MVTARLAIGSVSTLALGALLLGSAPYWLARHGAGSHAAPWGDVSALGIGQPAAAASANDQAQLLKLAALKAGTATEPAAVPASAPASAPPVQPAVVQSDPAPTLSATVQSDPAPEQPAVVASPPAQSADAAPVAQQVASVAEPAPAALVSDNDAKGDRVNINTAPASALDHLPGAGRIGRTIVSHRPYKSVKDLVNRRVLRAGDFQKIQDHISVD